MTCFSMPVFPQQYTIHKTDRTKELQIDNYSNSSVDAPVGGYCTIKMSKSNMNYHDLYYIVDTTATITARIYLCGVPRFYGGKVAVARVQSGEEYRNYNGEIIKATQSEYVLINTKGEILKTMMDATEASKWFVDGAILISGRDANYRSYLILIDSDFKPINPKQLVTPYNIHDPIQQGVDVSLFPLRNGLRKYFYYDGWNVKYGFINKNGDIIIKPQYLSIHDFSDGLAAFKENVDGTDYWGYIDTTANVVIPLKFRKEPGNFYNGFAVAYKQNGKRVYIDKLGNVKSPEYDAATRFFEGYAIVKQPNSNYFVIDTTFNNVREFNANGKITYNYYDKSFKMNDKLYYPDGTVKLDLSGGTLITDFVEDAAFYKCKDFSGLINTKGEVLFYFVESEF